MFLLYCCKCVFLLSAVSLNLERFFRENIVCIVIKPAKTKEMQKKGFHLYVECGVVHVLEIHERPQFHDVTDEPRSLSHGHQSFTRHLDYLWKRQGKGDSMKYHISGWHNRIFNVQGYWWAWSPDEAPPVFQHLYVVIDKWQFYIIKWLHDWKYNMQNKNLHVFSKQNK